MLFLIGFSKLVLCQTPSYTQYETSNGLPSNEVYNIIQDNKGFLWLGTDAGLVKYDGTRFTIYNNEKSKGNAVSYLRLDNNGNVWCVNFSGQIFYVANDKLELFELFEKESKVDFAKIGFDKNGNLIITDASNNLWHYNTASKTLSKHTFNAEFGLHFPHKTFDDNLILSNTNVSNKILLLRNNKLENMPLVNDKGNLVESKFYNRFDFYNSYLKKQTLAFQYLHFLNSRPNLFYFQGNKFIEHPATKLLQTLNAYPQVVFDDDNGNLLIGTAKNLVWLKKQNNGWQLFKTMFDGVSVSAITKDKEKNIWIGTLKNGIYKIANENIFTLDVNQKNAGANHLTTNNTTNLFCSFLDGEVLDYNIKTQQKYIAKFSEKRDVQTLVFNKYNQQVYTCLNNSYYYNPVNKVSLQLSSNYSNTKDVVFDSNNVVFTATNLAEVVFKNNQKIYDALLKKYDTVYYNYLVDKTIESRETKFDLKATRCRNVFYNQQSNILWYGFVDGLAFINNRKFEYIVHPKTKEPIITTQFAYDSTNKLMFVSTIKQGVLVFKNQKLVNEINTTNGLASNNIKKIRFYNNTLWLVVNDKIQSFNLTNKNITTIDMQDGLFSKELYDVEVLNDTVYVASSKGIQFFPTNIQTKNNLSPFVQIKNIKVDDSLYQSTQTLSLPYSIKNLQIELQSAAIKSNGTLVYQYRLLPYDTSWISISANENIIRFSSLNYGKYTFEVKAMNEDGVSSEIKSSTILINKPFWLQWWFIIFIACVIGCTVYILSKKRIEKQNQQLQIQLAKSRLEEELRRSQLSSLKAQMNPHFMFNALNSIQEFIILNDKQQANMFMGKFSDLMRKVLDMSTKDEVSLDEELATLKLYLELEALRFEENFNYTFNVDESIDITDVYLPSMLVQPYVENAIKHGLLHKQGIKELTINFEEKANSILTCTIKDNGIGRKRSNEMNKLKAKKHTSFATGATQTRLELLNAKRIKAIAVSYNDLVSKDGLPLGTEIIIEIPFTS